MASSILVKFDFFRNAKCITMFGVTVIAAAIILRHYFKKLKHKKEIVLEIKKPTDIIIVDDESDCFVTIQYLMEKIRSYPIVGLDCEWVSGQKRKPIALLQLATSDGYCVLFRLNKFAYIPAVLIKLLEDSSIIKVGSALSSDVKLLYMDYKIVVLGNVDIDKAAKIAGFSSGSLKRMAKDILHITLDKKKSIQCGNWEADILNAEQIEYAALDALIPVKILERIIKLKMNCQTMEKIDTRACFANLWNEIINVKYSFKSNPIKSKPFSISTPSVEKSVGINGSLYENCVLQDPDGRILCFCNNKKLDWYLRKNLGTEVSTFPSRTVRLNFYPAEYPRTKDMYYTIPKENMCVVCGDTNSLRRKNVVPWEYRTFFPKHLKDYKSHDILLLCWTCHVQSTLFSEMLRRELAVECNAPFIQRGLSNEARYLNKLKYTANALLKKNNKISLQRIEELTDFIRTHEKCENVTEDLLENIMARKISEDASFQSHGKKVVEYFQNRNSINELEARWRSYFLDTMKPRHMPPLWSVYHDP